MSEGHESRDRSATREEGGEIDIESEDERRESRPQAQLRWVQLREPKHAIEIGRNGRVLESTYHEGYDAWEVLLETYEGEV